MSAPPRMTRGEGGRVSRWADSLIAAARRASGASYLTILASVLLVLASTAAWVRPPIRGPLWGFRIPLWAELDVWRVGVAALSYGGAALAAGVLGFLSLAMGTRRAAWARAAVAVGALLLALRLFSHLAVLEVGVREELIGLSGQQETLSAFTRRHLYETNAGAPVTAEQAAGEDTLAEQVTTALSLLGRGVGLAFAASLAMAGALAAAARRRGRGLAAACFLLVMVAGAYGALTWVPAVRAQLSIEAGARLTGRGEYARALSCYEQAARMNPRLVGSGAFHAARGEALDKLGRKGEPEAHLYRGNLMLAAGDAEQALFEYEQGKMKAKEPLRSVLARSIAEAWVDMGMASYEQGNAQRAIAEWQRAKAIAPDQVQVDFLLSRAQFEAADYRAAVAAGEAFVQRCGDRVLSAQAFANMGDAFSRLNDFASARECYERSRDAKELQNYRALTALGGT